MQTPCKEPPPPYSSCKEIGIVTSPKNFLFSPFSTNL
nr:MAG TPA: hypothetical protein [Caudoviricetes sp.]